MKIIESIDQANTYIASLKADGKTIGFVPTLGGLHKGHQHLFQRARTENDITVISIFLNPMQFRKKQFQEYPSDFIQDTLVARQSCVDMIFHPQITGMYQYIEHIDDFFHFQEIDFKLRHHDNFIIETNIVCGIDNLIRVPASLVYQLDGKKHPWFFDGSATVVNKLLKILQPTKAYFGEKDIQQLAITTRLVEICFPDTKIIGVPTLREADNLAFSSRNVLLSKEQRNSALNVYHALKYGENLVREGESNAGVVLQAIKKIIEEQPLIKIDYLDIVDKKLLNSVTKISNSIILYAAFFLNEIRLTDTIIVEL